MLSESGRHLWATARGKTNTTVGYINGFLLDEDERIAKTMFTVPTTTTGGGVNGISPANFSDEYAVLTDTPRATSRCSRWRVKHGKHGLEYTTARPVGNIDLPDGGCCVNAV
jgi:carboxy-cis,cis-muconate cyclase